MELERLDLVKFLMILRQYIAIIILVTLIGALGAGLYTSYMVTPLYQSYANLIIYNRGSSLSDNNTTSSVTSDQLTTSAQLVDTYAVILKSETVMEEVVLQLRKDYPGEMDWLSSGALGGMVSVSQVNGTQVMRIAVTCSDQSLATKLISGIIETAPNRIIEILRGGSVEVLTSPHANGKVYPSVKRNALMGGAISFVLIVAVVLLIGLMDRSVKKAEDIQRQLDLPVIGVIPRMEDVR